MGQEASARTRERARRGEGHLLRDQLIGAASDLLGDLGHPNLLSMRAVAAAAGVTPPSIYRHFADKDALLVAVLEERWAELHRRLVGAAEQGTNPFDALRRSCLAYLAFAEEHPGHYRVIFSAATPAGLNQDDPTSHPGAETFMALVELVERCLASGARAQPAKDSFFLAMQVWLSGHGLVDLRIGRRFPFPWPPAEELLDAMLDDLGLVPGPEVPRSGDVLA